MKSYLVAALCLAAFFRLMTSIFVYGPQAVDDYSHGLIPTFELLRGIQPDLPNWRSPLLIWTLFPLAKLAEVVGLHVSFDIFRVIMAGLALFSLWGIWAFGHFVVRRSGYYFNLGGPIVPGVKGGDLYLPNSKSLLFVIPLALISLHGVISFAVTRAFGESIAITLVLVGLLWMDEGLDRRSFRNRSFWLGSILLGIACLYRYQIGVLAVGFAVFLIFRRDFIHLAILAAAGLISAAIAGLVDLAFGRVPLSTLYNYLYVNRNGAVEWSTQPWYNTWLTAMVIMLIPLSLPFFKRGFSRLLRFEKLFIGLSLFFIFLHSLIPHKEERFLYPIAPLLLILLGRIWAKSWGTLYEKYFFRPVVVGLLGLALVLFAFSNSQEGEYKPIMMAERMKGPVAIWDVESLLGPSFFRERLVFAPVSYKAHENWPNSEELSELQSEGRNLLLVTSNPERLGSMEEWGRSLPPGLLCQNPEKIQSLGDQLIYAGNPERNVRRKPSWVQICRWQG